MDGIEMVKVGADADADADDLIDVTDGQTEEDANTLASDSDAIPIGFGPEDEDLSGISLHVSLNQTTISSSSVQYHEVIYSLLSPRFGAATQILTVLCLVGLCVAQYIATATNLYIIDAGCVDNPWSKRAWTTVTFMAYVLMCFANSFKDYRLLALTGIVATTFASLVLFWSSIAMIKKNNAAGIEVEQCSFDSFEDFFRGSMTTIFAWGGHSMLIEVMSTLKSPEEFNKPFLYVA